MGKDTIDRAGRVLARIDERREIKIDWSDYMNGPAPGIERAMIDCIKTGAGYWTTPTPETRICICCGAPASEVQHD